MDEKIKVSITVPENLVGRANQFLRLLAFPMQVPDGELRPPPVIGVERGGSGLRRDYVVENLTLRGLSSDAIGDPRATVIEVVAVPIRAGDGKIEYDVFVCPECKAEHLRGPLDPLSQVYRCLKCGYVGRKVEDEWVPCPECGVSGVGDKPSHPMREDICLRCGGKGRVRKDEPGPMVVKGGEVEKGPVDEAVTVENEEEFKGEFGDGETFQSDPRKQELKRRILDRMTAKDMVDAISNGCDLPNLADIIIGIYPEEEILGMTPKEGVCPKCLAGDKDIVTDCERCSGTGTVIVENEKEKALILLAAKTLILLAAKTLKVQTDLIDRQVDKVIDDESKRDDLVVCPKCGGSGFGHTVASASYCQKCNGEGVVPAPVSESSSPSIAEYPREVVCESCDCVVAFARAHVKTEDTIRAIDLVKSDGTDYKQFDFVCDNCHAAGPFTVRDRARKCLHCDGAGVEIGFPDDDAPNPPPCPCCKGTGKIPKE